MSAKSSVPRMPRSCPGGSSAGRRDIRSSSHSPTPSTATFAGRCSRRSRGSSPPRDVRVLAWFRGGEPALLERTKGRGKVLWFTSACDRAWGDWPRGRMYLPMLHQMVAYVSGLAEGGRIRQAIAERRAETGRRRVRRTRSHRQPGSAGIRNGPLSRRKSSRTDSASNYPGRLLTILSRRARAGWPTIACGATRSGPGWH